MLRIRHYLAFGREDILPTDEPGDELGFLGMLYDPDLNLYFTGSNLYDPETARQLSPSKDVEKSLISGYCAESGLNPFDWYGLDNRSFFAADKNVAVKATINEEISFFIYCPIKFDLDIY